MTNIASKTGHASLTRWPHIWLLGSVACLSALATQAQADPPLIWVMENPDTLEAVDPYLSTYGAAKTVHIWQGYFDFEEPYGFVDDWDEFEDFLDEFIPPNWDGPVVVDWETGWIDYIYAGSSAGQAYWDRLDEGIAIMDLINDLRPNALRGFYAIPGRGNYGDGPTVWHNQNDHLVTDGLIPSCKALFPSCYDLYPNGSPFPPGSEQLEDIVEDLELALELGEDLSLPVFPYVWMRW
jgi:hypothetical protein